MTDPSPTRASLRSPRRILIKAGTSVITQPNGHPSLTRIASLAESVQSLVASGAQVILVSSGAVGMGRKVMHTANLENTTIRSLATSLSSPSLVSVGGLPPSGPPAPGPPPGPPLSGGGPPLGPPVPLQRSPSPLDVKNYAKNYSQSCAAAGQFELMKIYSMMFEQLDLRASQLLLTQEDFGNEKRLGNLRSCVDFLLDANIVPIINEVSG